MRVRHKMFWGAVFGNFLINVVILFSYKREKILSLGAHGGWYGLAPASVRAVVFSG